MSRELSVQELFGSYNVLQYALVFQAGNHLRKWESENSRVATDEEINSICRSVLNQQKIIPSNEILRLLNLSVTAFCSSDACETFCNNYENRPDKSFNDEDAQAVAKICDDFVSNFLKK